MVFFSRYLAKLSLLLALLIVASSLFGFIATGRSAAQEAPSVATPYQISSSTFAQITSLRAARLQALSRGTHEEAAAASEALGAYLESYATELGLASSAEPQYFLDFKCGYIFSAAAFNQSGPEGLYTNRVTCQL